MRKFVWALVCAVALGFASRTPARAQYGSDVALSQGWDVRIGFFIPERQSVRAAEGDILFAIGAEKAFYEIERWRATLSLDYYGSGKVYNVPIQLNLRGDTGGVRYGAGMGVGLSHDLTRGITGFAWNLLLGYTLQRGNHPVFFDVRYNALATGGDLNGWSFMIGSRF